MSKDKTIQQLEKEIKEIDKRIILLDKQMADLDKKETKPKPRPASAIEKA